MTALRRMTFGNLGGLAAATALVLAAPALAQNSDAPIDVTAAPPPSAETIGPAQLRDFDLRGTVTRPSNQPVATPAQPADTATAQPRSGEAVPAEAAAPSPSLGRSADQRPSSNLDERTSPDAAGSSATEPPITPSLPLEVTTDPAPQPSAPESSLTANRSDDVSGFLSWPWLAALIALVGGGAFLAWSRRERSRRYGDPGRMAFAGLAPDAVEPEAAPLRPRADPVPPRGQRSGPRPDPVPPAGTPRPSSVPKPPSDFWSGHAVPNGAAATSEGRRTEPNPQAADPGMYPAGPR